MKVCISLTNAALGVFALAGLTLFMSAANANALPSGVPDFGVAADRYVQSEVSCNGGQALAAVRSRVSGIEQVSYASINVRLGKDSKPLPVTCSDGEYRLDGKALTNTEVATYAIANRPYTADSKDWVLILTPLNQSATYVPGFSSEVACKQAVNIWQGRGHAKNDLPGHAVCVQR
ncbi:hypothetical protein SJI00_21050 [Pseudomonas sp. RP23018S]|uniref:hypothetical protein n=1 Tax=Pseudomonas sp. RP23018S TaxID=3096037 RepID=UPI002ACA58DB|nr:hypothetical protein [Pseudomonas sp. RP23018S]MDZ5605265.1 hypothetical protein [Pseudomonas sp. RP23018S]